MPHVLCREVIPAKVTESIVGYFLDKAVVYVPSGAEQDQRRRGGSPAPFGQFSHWSIFSSTEPEHAAPGARSDALLLLLLLLMMGGEFRLHGAFFAQRLGPILDPQFRVERWSIGRSDVNGHQ